MGTKNVVLISGISSGMGKEAAKIFLNKGWIVYGGARRLDLMKHLTNLGVHTGKLDVTDEASVEKLVGKVINEQGRIDVLINNAGYGEYGPLEEVPVEKAKHQFEVNLFGAARMTHAVLPIMKKQHSGRIINISSIAGDIYTPLGGWYHSSKAALSMWSDVLDLEIKLFGMRSITIQPGGTKSEWLRLAVDNAKNNAKNSSYTKLTNQVAKTYGKFSQGATSTDLAKLFYKAATDKKPKRRYYHSAFDRGSVITARTFPGLYKFIVRKLFRLS